MKKLLFFVIAFSIHCAASAADSFSTVEERMSGKEFKETGLVKLTDTELATLNDWLRRHSVATLANAAARPASLAGTADDSRGFEKQAKDHPTGKIINSTIIGAFDGWSGKGTLFKLANGMVWRQVQNDTFYVKPVENAQITIKKGMFGNWSLSMVGHNSEVRVKRVK